MHGNGGARMERTTDTCAEEAAEHGNRCALIACHFGAEAKSRRCNALLRFSTMTVRSELIESN